MEKNLKGNSKRIESAKDKKSIILKAIKYNYFLPQR